MTSTSPPQSVVTDDNEEQPVSKRQKCNTSPQINNKSSSSTSNGDHNHHPVESSLSSSEKSSSSSLLEGIKPSVLSDVALLKERYMDGKPYRHGMIDGLCPDGFLDKVLDELKHHSQVKFKESDLFRVYQSIDLGNLTPSSPLATKMPHLMTLKTSLYSSTFRRFVEEISDLEPGTLTEQVDCAANCHTKGCHLLCHDDVINNRKISFIIYLTDKNWSNGTDGGGLELYDSRLVGKNKKLKYPVPCPSTTICPTFNNFAYFKVTPGESFHSVREVMGERPRLSIQGWYHAATPPDNMENATLSRLKLSTTPNNNEDDDDDDDEDEGVFIPLPPPSSQTPTSSSTLSPSDLQYLSTHINPTYLTPTAITEISQQFESESSIQLRDFLHPSLLPPLSSALHTVDDETTKIHPPRYDTGVSESWSIVGPPHKRRYLRHNHNPSVSSSPDDDDTTDDDPPGRLLSSTNSQLFSTPPFLRYLSLVTSLPPPISSRTSIRRFRPGLDYTVAHKRHKEEYILDVTLCLARESDRWDDGECGGFECYVAATEEEGKEDTYEDDGEEEEEGPLVSVSAGWNELNVVYRDPGTMRFVKYVGSDAPGSRWDVSVEYRLPPDDDEEGDGDDEQKQQQETEER